jgi:hypothetical protein
LLANQTPGALRADASALDQQAAGTPLFRAREIQDSRDSDNATFKRNFKQKSTIQ